MQMSLEMKYIILTTFTWIETMRCKWAVSLLKILFPDTNFRQMYTGMLREAKSYMLYIMYFFVIKQTFPLEIRLNSNEICTNVDTKSLTRVVY